MIRAERLSNRYRRGPLVLAGADLALEPGVPAVLACANGSGKSTLLSIVAGCSTPTAGRVWGRPRVVGYLPDRRGCDRGERRGGSSRLSIRKLRATETVGGSS